MPARHCFVARRKKKESGQLVVVGVRRKGQTTREGRQGSRSTNGWLLLSINYLVGSTGGNVAAAEMHGWFPSIAAEMVGNKLE